MSIAHITLLLIGLICLAESLWAISFPERYRDAASRIAGDAGPDEPSAGIAFCVMTILIWAIAATGQSWAHRGLFLIGTLLMLITFLAFRTGGLKRLMDGILIRRSTAFIRLIYLVEFAIAIACIAVALTGK